MFAPCKCTFRRNLWHGGHSSEGWEFPHHWGPQPPVTPNSAQQHISAPCKRLELFLWSQSLGPSGGTEHQLSKSTQTSSRFHGAVLRWWGGGEAQRTWHSSQSILARVPISGWPSAPAAPTCTAQVPRGRICCQTEGSQAGTTPADGSHTACSPRSGLGGEKLTAEDRGGVTVGSSEGTGQRGS